MKYEYDGRVLAQRTLEREIRDHGENFHSEVPEMLPQMQAGDRIEWNDCCGYHYIKAV